MKQLTEQLAQAVVRPRQRNTYKGSFGKILIVGGNAQFGGAAIMSASAAVYAGADSTCQPCVPRQVGFGVLP